MKKIIIDTDPGIDDAFALVLAMKSDLNILGITTVAGNRGLKQTTNNASRIIKLMNYNTKVYQGSSYNLKAINNKELQKNIIDAIEVHGFDGLGGSNLEIDSNNISDLNAIDFILEEIKKYPNEIEIIAIGPLTNIALAIKKDFETMCQVKAIHIMGGGINITNVTEYAEFNFFYDPEAVEIVLGLGSFVELNIIGLDVTHQVITNLNDLFFYKHECGELGKILAEMAVSYVEMYYSFNGYMGAVMHDLIVLIGVLEPSIYTNKKTCFLNVYKDEERKGQITIASKVITNANYNFGIDVKKTKLKIVELFDKGKVELYLKYLK